MKQKIKIDVVSDVVCPWCYIGKRRLEKALEELNETFEFDVDYHPFELNAAIPLSGVNSKTYLSEKFGSEEHYEQITGRVTAVAQTEGLIFDFNKQLVSPNTRKAHSLIKAAKESGVQTQVVEALFKAYFTDGVDLSNDENLIQLAVAAGLSKQLAEDTLKDEEATLQIALEEQEMHKLGITGVPFYIINRKYGISGAQPTDTFIRALRDASAQTSMVGESCDVDGKNC